MAGGKITRIVKGVNSIECDSWTVYTDKFTAYANNGSHFTADGGTNFGEPKDPPPVGKYFVKGWWTDENDKTIKEATIGNKVKFHLQMQNIPKDDDKRQVKMELRDFEEFSLLYYILGIETDKFKGYDEISIKAYDENKNVYSKEYWEIDSSNKIVIKLNLDGDSLIKMLAKEHDRNLELYFRCSYSNPENYIEVLHFPEMESDYLKVNPPPIVEPIIFVEASQQHKLPALYSADDGSPWYVNIISGMEDAKDQAEKVAGDIEIIKNFFAEGGGASYEPDEINKWTKRSYEIAVRKLNKGELIFNDGTKGVTNRYHRYTVSDIDGTYSQQVMMGVNRGKFKKGVTSKGINQLEAQASRGVARVFKTVGELNPFWDAICDVADILVSAANGERPPLPFTPPFVSDYIDRYFDEMYEDFRERWKNDLFKAVVQGKHSVNEYLSKRKYKDEKSLPNLGFQLIELSEEGIRKILTKEITCVNDKTNPKIPLILESLPNIGEGPRDAGILVQSLENDDEYGRLVKHHYIHAIFLKDLVI